MELARPVIVENLGKDARVPVEKVLVEHVVIVGKSLREPRQSSGRDLFERLQKEKEKENDDKMMTKMCPALFSLSGMFEHKAFPEATSPLE